MMEKEALRNTKEDGKVIERIYQIVGADPQMMYGKGNVNMRCLRTFFPKVHIVAHGNIIKVSGDANDTQLIVSKLQEMEHYCEEFNMLDSSAIRSIMEGAFSLDKEKAGNLIIYGINGKPIIARNAKQKQMVASFEKNDLLFVLGPAGTGKTYVAIALAVKALKNKVVKRIILSRPAVEAGERLGFLPGEMKDKLDPYLQPLYDALQDMIPAVKLKKYMEDGVIQIAPLAYMRGRTLNDAVVILDEAQNTTKLQIKMFLTRLGMNAKMIITGDVTQIDLPPVVTSGLVHAISVLESVSGIGRVEFTKKEIVRHLLVQKIVAAYALKE